jgi:hypothetical protein
MFDIVIMRNPPGDWSTEEGDRQTNLAIDGSDFLAIQKFIDVSIEPVEYSKDEVWIEYHQWQKERYLNAAAEKGYEMLGRFWYEYDDAVYLSQEINQLREECLKVKNSSQNLDLIIAADKILEACDEASKTGSGLLFGCD